MKETFIKNKRGTKMRIRKVAGLPFAIVAVIVLLATLARPSFAGGEVGPTAIHISWDNPNPNAQAGLLRALDDGDEWTFQLVLDTPPNCYFSVGPTWGYPSKGGADPSWGTCNGGDGTTTLNWLSGDDQSGTFTVTVTGTLTLGTPGGSGGGGGPAPQSEPFSASWTGQVANATILVSRTGSGDTPASSATVAAGAIGNPAHQADILVTCLDSSGTPLVGVPIPPVILKLPTTSNIGALGATSADVTATVSMTSTTTDGNGQAKGTFKSGSRVADTVIQVDLGQGDGNPSATLHQVWNQLSDDDAWEYDYDDLGTLSDTFTFDYATASTAYYQMQYTDDGGAAVPISGHSMTMYNTAITCDEWNASAGPDCGGVPMGDYVTHTYTPSDTGVDSAGNSDPWDALDGLCSWSGVSETSAGLYSADITVGLDGTEIYWVDDVYFDMTDNDTYDANGAN